MAERFLTAYNTTTGEKLSNPVPEHWFDHPVLGKNISRTPRARAAAAARKPAAPTRERATPKKAERETVEKRAEDAAPASAEAVD